MGLNKYIQLSLEMGEVNPWCDLIVDDLANVGFESFDTKENIVHAFVKKEAFSEKGVEQVISAYKNHVLKSSIQEIEDENWNAQWESDFQPIDVEGKCIVKASFHNVEGQYKYEIIIDPKMSFGTGHHATTYLMLKKLMDMDLRGMDVLDMGAGTGVLAIMASYRKASSVLAIDIDPWAYENCVENITNNKIDNTKVLIGDSSLLHEKLFNIILANINLNVLIGDMPRYVNSLNPGGEILFSGILEQDLDKLVEVASNCGLSFVGCMEKEGWQLVHFIKERS